MIIRYDASSHYSFVPIVIGMRPKTEHGHSNFNHAFYICHFTTEMKWYIYL